MQQPTPAPVATTRARLAPAADAPDPHAWLEAVDDPAALDWVAAQNARTEALLEDPASGALCARLQGILDDRARIAHVRGHGAWLYNFWRDATHQRGLWRRTTLGQYRQAAPAWETVLDLDALAHSEQENWVWAGATLLEPDGARCLVALSRGGGDAAVRREFDLDACAFVADGFFLPEAKSSVAWIDADTLFVATDFGPGSLTASGYPRCVKTWRRGTPLSAARTVFEGDHGDLSVSAHKDQTPGFERQFVTRQHGFYSSELFFRTPGTAGELLRRIDKPDDANAFIVRSELLIELRSDWLAGGVLWPQGALLATDFNAFLDGAREFQPLFTPSPSSSLDGVTVTADALLLTILDNVSNRLLELRHAGGRWQQRIVETPPLGTLSVAALDEWQSNAYFLTHSDFLTPATLYLGEVGSDLRTPLKAMPAWFDASACQVAQYSARSPDGTLVPYFVVSSNMAPRDGSTPTLLYGYGGFEVALKPAYSALLGAAWLEAGGAYVLANIRGGGEFGPRWHQGALKQRRQHAFDDFLAVAEDLIGRGMTSPAHLGIMGGSNGGLLVGAALTQRPELFRAVVCQVPLLDMRRYHTLLAGASWMGEYGNPDEPADWAYIGAYSPYHQVSAACQYPPVLLTSSTRDDRVHPAHARKMAARMQAQGHTALYWENTEGGHAGAANNLQQARMWALTYRFLQQQLACAHA